MRGLVTDPRGKFSVNWSGSYIIAKLTPERAALLMDIEGHKIVKPTDVDQLKKFYT